MSKELPKNVRWLVAVLREAGFEEVHREELGMDSGLIVFRRDPVELTLVKERSQWSVALTAPGEVVEFPLLHGFAVRPRYEPWAPTIDLVRIALEVGEIFAADAYHQPEVNVAAWPGTPGDYPQVRATVEVEAVASDPATSISAAVSETESVEAAAELAAAIEQHWKRGALGIAEGSLACLLRGGSLMMGERNWESRGKLRRFEEPIRQLLRDATAIGSESGG